VAAFDPRAEFENARRALTLETAAWVRFQAIQVTGLIARSIVAQLERTEG
jgi:phosphatidylserine decarboxylase